MNRLGNIQALRAVAVLLVVARHLQLNVTRAAGGHAPPSQFLIGDMGVDLFFVISGFILVTVHETPAARPADAAVFLYRRVSRIYPLYWLYSLPALAINFWRPYWLHRTDAGEAIDPLRSFLLLPQRHWPPLGQAWSLAYEMYFYVAFAGLLLLPGKWFLRGLLGWSFLVLAGNALLTSMPALASVDTGMLFSIRTLEFIAGALAALAMRHTKPEPQYGAWGWVAAGLAVAWIVGLWLNQANLTGNSRVAGYGPPSVALVYGLMILEKAGRGFPRFFTLIGDWSYSIYLSHMFVVGALAHVFSLQPAHGRTARILLEIGSVAAVLLAGALSYQYLEIPLLRLSRRPLRAWTGEPSAEPVSNPT